MDSDNNPFRAYGRSPSDDILSAPAPAPEPAPPAPAHLRAVPSDPAAEAFNDLNAAKAFNDLNPHEVVHRFTYQPPHEEAAGCHRAVTQLLIATALRLRDLCPSGYEFDHAMAALETVRHRANAAIALDWPRKMDGTPFSRAELG